MQNLRTHGAPPFTIAVIHGGPGAGGEMAPVGRELADAGGILEPIQTATTLEGQIEELKSVLKNYGHPAMTLIGYSWGAWLSYLVAARYPELVEKLILVASGPFEEEYVPLLHETRMKRLSGEERNEFEATIEALSSLAAEDRDALLARLGALASKADTYEALSIREDESDAIGPDGGIFQGVWQTAAELRRSGELLARGKRISCPVIAIHGDYDPHPAEGVAEPLSRVLPDFRLVLLERCGHTPWIERHAREHFYRAIRENLE